jgi:hypothetical protein
MKNKKYVFELVVRESENLEKVCSAITACDYNFEQLKERKVDHEILFCKDILVDQLPKKRLQQILKDHTDSVQQDPSYPTFTGSWDDKTYKEISEQRKEYSECCTDEYGFKLNHEEEDSLNSEISKSYGNIYAFYHKSTKLWVYFLPNYIGRQVISLGLKNDATTFKKDEINYFKNFLKSCSFNGNKNYGKDNFLEFELRTA